MMEQSAIILCQCAHFDSIPNDIKESIFNALQSSHVKFESVDDLCGLAAQKDTFFQRIKKMESLSIIACSHRAVKWLFHYAGEDMPAPISVLSMRELDTETIFHSIGIKNNSHTCRSDQSKDRSSKNAWIPWFPVIDYDRCTNCMQCLNFCLFRVYEINGNGRVTVSHPENCKTGCPACARVCPENAIIFPKHSSSQINGSELIQNEIEENNNLETLLKGDLQEILQKRNAGARGNLLSTDDLALAQEERKKCGCQTNALVHIGSLPIIDDTVNTKQSVLPSNRYNSACSHQSTPNVTRDQHSDSQSDSDWKTEGEKRSSD